MKKVKLLTPCYNEGPSVQQNLTTILEAATAAAEDIEISLIAVNDGSTDATLHHLQSLADLYGDRVEILSFVSNFGKEAAIYAGLQFSSDADAVIVIDADLEHPPELIPQMISHWLAGYRVVECRKQVHDRQSTTRNFLAKIFYRTMATIAKLDLESESDYKLLDREVVLQYLKLPEKNRFFKGLVKWMNYETKALMFEVPTTTNRSSRWSIFNLFNYGITALTSFTALPLQIITLLGLMVFLVSAVFGAITLYMKLTGTSVDGFTTVIVLQALFSSAIMFSIGLIGVYIGKMYDELKNRPVFIVDKDKSRLLLDKRD